jgi:hypothetical protein
LSKSVYQFGLPLAGCFLDYSFNKLMNSVPGCFVFTNLDASRQTPTHANQQENKPDNQQGDRPGLKVRDEERGATRSQPA